MLNAQLAQADRYQADRYQRFADLAVTVGDAINAIAGLNPAQRTDVDFLEREFIPALGLNDELLHEQPPELAPNFGKGLHLWQYPNQLAPYLAWLARNSSGVSSYMEIGCRWGGMFVLVTEWLRNSGADLKTVIALDPIAPTPFISTYFDLLQQQAAIEPIYIQDFSTSPLVGAHVDRLKPDFVFIDGDHSLRGALQDHLLVRSHARIIVHHDIHSQACPDTTLLWKALKQFEAPSFDTFEFTSQYLSINGSFLGIGAMKRRSAQM
ncbi:MULTISPECIES: class I SAM-dependent methyltransferase [Bradyrhizobium]|uniref:Class I SAM-dependent methyltransferase n=1 Tax=Bradyrhizobium brasilense TaxID=1419277 RepID=A0ABY8JUJ1_9BRAD|nr:MULTISPECIES: hypothetical protein [Bradyrhizobium]MCP1851418.1 hypothetical protein [Bradyrhizobium sp. USDA 4541]OMI03667.1 hypothetical protein BSN85_27170 [Bradyrhizobium brasilense]WFU67593.1 hypothetical protein QA636_19725 [Bradyrhizobium brasilense]